MNNINLPNHDSYAYIKSRYYKKPKSKTITKVNGNRLDEIEKEMEYNKSKYEKRIKQLKVITGKEEAVKEAMSLAKEKGARAVIPLKVSGAFHSPLMSMASSRLSEEIESTEISRCDMPVMANVCAEYISEPDEIKSSLVKQLDNPVRWSQSMQNLIADGTEEFYEIGPGKVLAGILKKIDPTKKTRSINDFNSLVEN